MNQSLRGLEDYYRRIVFSVADQTTPRDNRVDVLTKPTITTPTRLRTALFTRLSHETFVRSCSRLLGGWVEKKIVDIGAEDFPKKLLETFAQGNPYP